MKLHRFYVGAKRPREVQHFGAQRCWVQEKELLHQWKNVLRFRLNEDIILFDDDQEIIYKIEEIKPDEVALNKVTETKRKIEQTEILIAWSLLKRDNNDLVIQKCTELGVSKFIPLQADRSEKLGYDTDRALKIIIEAAEQCGRGDIPEIHEPMAVEDFVHQFKDSYEIFVADENTNERLSFSNDRKAIIIGPEGGWSDSEMEFFNTQNLNKLQLGSLTLRAETAAIAATTKLLK